MSDDQPDTAPPHHDARIRLIWELAVLHLKLLVEAVRDLFLSPISIIAVIIGLVAGGDKPDIYFRRVQRFGRRSDLWLNVFGSHHRGPSADEIVRPIQEKLLAQTKSGGRFVRGAEHVNQLLDAVNRKNAGRKPTEDSEP
jgi:hypothetical protein